jgi:type IV pilus assembly protein PilE
VEVLVALALAALVATMGLQGWKGQDLRSGRLDAVAALTQVQQAQEAYRSAHGLYTAELTALRGTAPTSPQGRYQLAIELQGAEGYRATAQATGAQARDSACALIVLEVRQGFAQAGPDRACWLR